MSLTLLALLTSVLPFVRVPLSFGPIHPFGVLVGIGVALGFQLAMRRARVLGLDLERFERHVVWTVAIGFVASHVLDTIFYHPEVLLHRPWELLLIYQGLSSFGGFLGGVAGFLLYARRHQVDAWRSADAIAYGLPVGWLFGRMGCASIHDHPGARSASALAVNWPGGPRFDLGLLELLLVPLLIVAVLLVARRTARPGSLITTLALLYPPIRFPLDFLRASAAEGGDVRYGGFTPGQYASLGLFAVGLGLLHRLRRSPTGGVEPASPLKP
jgi:phosphatidylglycerol:prolipoprotein diacylglycerol transferase